MLYRGDASNNAYGITWLTYMCVAPWICRECCLSKNALGECARNCVQRRMPMQGRVRRVNGLVRSWMIF